MANEKAVQTAEVPDPKVRQSDALIYVRNKERMQQLDMLEGELAQDLRAKQEEAAEAVIAGNSCDVLQVVELEARLGLMRRAVEILERRIASFERTR